VGAHARGVESHLARPRPDGAALADELVHARLRDDAGAGAIDVDPAVSSGPFVTTTTDIVGFLAFLGIATLWFGL